MKIKTVFYNDKTTGERKRLFTVDGLSLLEYLNRKLEKEKNE